jgi:hypothetical protein
MALSMARAPLHHYGGAGWGPAFALRVLVAADDLVSITGCSGWAKTLL